MFMGVHRQWLGGTVNQAGWKHVQLTLEMSRISHLSPALCSDVDRNEVHPNMVACY